MKIDDAVLKKVEELARLRLEDDEKKRIFERFNNQIKKR